MKRVLELYALATRVSNTVGGIIVWLSHPVVL